MGAHAAGNYTCSDWRLFFFFPQEVQTPVSLHQVVCFLGTCVSRAGRRKDSGQQGQTRQPLRSHQVCRDTLEHSEPDGICPQGCEAGQMTYRHRGRQSRQEEWRMAHPAFNAQYVQITGMQLWMVTPTTLSTNYTVTPCHHRRALTYNHTPPPPPTPNAYWQTRMHAQRCSRKHVASISHQITYILNNMAHMLMWNVKAWCSWAAHDAYACACG